MEQNQTAVADSSPATFEVPQDSAARTEWLKTGEIPAARAAEPKEEKPAPSKPASAENPAESEAASATANQQEKSKRKSESAQRLDELLADLKNAGFTPTELKTFRRQAAAAAEPAKSEPAKPSEKTANPQALEKPVKPNWKDIKPDGSPKWASWEEFDQAKDEYHDAMATFKAAEAVAADRQQRAAEAQQKVLMQKVSDAKARYGDETESTIGAATRAIYGAKGDGSDSPIPLVVRQLIEESPVIVDAMYTLGQNPEELAAFVDLAKSNPGAAIRKFALIEHLVQQELAKGTAKQAPVEPDGEITERDDTGRFVSKPAKQKPPAPPPPEELNTRRSAPPDASEAAFRDGNFRAFYEEENRREIARRKGA
jgi:hypothetical protein